MSMTSFKRTTLLLLLVIGLTMTVTKEHVKVSDHELGSLLASLFLLSFFMRKIHRNNEEKKKQGD
jgi:hypothetical protein